MKTDTLDPFALDDQAPALPRTGSLTLKRDLQAVKAKAEQADIDRTRHAVNAPDEDEPFGAKKDGGSVGDGRVASPASAEDRSGSTTWTPAMRRVYVALTSATWKGRSIRELARLAKVSERRFRQLRTHPAIVEMLRSETTGQLRDHSVVFVDKLVESIKVIGREGAKDRELYARVTGLMPSGKVDHRVSGKVEHEHTIGGALTTALRRARQARIAAAAPQDVENQRPTIDVTPST